MKKKHKLTVTKQRMTDDERRGQILVGFDDLCLLGVPYSRQHLQRLIKEGKFPQREFVEQADRVCAR